MPIRVLINGAHGKMGQTAVASIAQETDLNLVAATGRQDDLAKSIQTHQADIVIDLTLPETVFNNTQTIIANEARPIIGTSGLTLEQVKTLQQQCDEKSLGGVIAPNLCVGAVLMMKYAQDAAKYLPNVEIIEMHHEKKVDAPSGTASKTAQMIEQSRQTPKSHKLPHATTATLHHGVPVHSVRLPGLFAHQMVIFGGHGETLTLRHDSQDRNAMMPGLWLACRQAMQLNHLVYGLEHLL